MSSGTLSKRRFRVVLACFFLSGVAGLIYQVAWTKSLGLVFGHTVYAIATVLAAFMAGLAAGGAYFGSRVRRHPSPLALYAKIELLIAATGALSLAGLSGVRMLYLATYHFAAESTPILVALRLLASSLVLFLPTFLMGGTLPILAGALTRGSSEVGPALGRLYCVNTAGGVAGALAAGFFLLPQIGLRWTIVSAVVLNLVAGALALAFAAKFTASEPVQSTSAAPTSEVAPPRYLLITFALVGATAMIYEVAWARLLATTLGSSTYAFSVMLATFLAGIAIGGQLFERWSARGGNITLGTYSTTQLLTGLGGVIFLLVFGQLASIMWTLIDATHRTFGGLVVAQLAICSLAILPTAVVFGFNFPVVTVLIAGRRDSEGSSSAGVGRACAANTIGAIAGSIAAGFWLVPLVGSFRLVAFTAAANLALAVFLLGRETPIRRYALAGVAALAAIAALAGYSNILYDPATANFGVIPNRSLFPDTWRLSEAVRMNDIVFAEDGLNASIAVIQGQNNLALLTNGKADASTNDTLTQLMLGHLGMVFHPAPKKVLIIGFGSGMTASAVARYPDVQQIDIIEIEPAMLHAAPHLAPLNRDVLRDPRVHVIVDDARNFLFATRNQYDLIISEPSNPWIAGVANLFTEEFYRQIRSRLGPGGMLVQWVQMYSMYPRDFKMILNTIAGNFPQVSVWQSTNSDVVLLAQSQSGFLSLDRMHRLWSQPLLRADYDRMGLASAEGLLGYSLLDDPDVRTLTTGADRNTDDLTRLEYRAPQAIFAGTAADNIKMLSRQRAHLLPQSVLVADQRHALVAAAQVVSRLNQPSLEAAYMEAIGGYAPSSESELLRGTWLLTNDKLDDARVAFGDARQLDPSSGEALLGLAEVARLQNDAATAQKFLDQSLAQNPHSVLALSSYVLLEKGLGDWKAALAWQQKRITAEKDAPADAYMQLAELLWRTGDVRGAADQYIAVLSSDPYNSEAHYYLGEILRRQRDWNNARVQLEIAVRYYPVESPQAYLSLADVYRNLGQTGLAAATIQSGQRIFPDNKVLAQSALAIAGSN
jgi:spermidine synthase